MHVIGILGHSSEIRGLCLSMKLSREMLKNFLPYLWNKKNQIVFFFPFLSNFGFVAVDALVYVDIVKVSTTKNPRMLEMKNKRKTI